VRTAGRRAAGSSWRTAQARGTGSRRRGCPAARGAPPPGAPAAPCSPRQCGRAGRAAGMIRWVPCAGTGAMPTSSAAPNRRCGSPSAATTAPPCGPPAPYSMAQASYDLARLARNGLIARRPHVNTCDLTPDGLKFAIFYAKAHNRVLGPLFAAGQPRPHPSSALRFAPSNSTSTSASPTPACPPQPENSAHLAESLPQRVATLRPGLHPEGAARARRWFFWSLRVQGLVGVAAQVGAVCGGDVCLADRGPPGLTAPKVTRKRRMVP
jgi:hypothetical protein